MPKISNNIYLTTIAHRSILILGISKISRNLFSNIKIQKNQNLKKILILNYHINYRKIRYN